MVHWKCGIQSLAAAKSASAYIKLNDSAIDWIDWHEAEVINERITIEKISKLVGTSANKEKRNENLSELQENLDEHLK